MLFQKFFTDTLISRFIKTLLQTTPIPYLPYVQKGDYIIKDCRYIWKDQVYQAGSSGIFNEENQLILCTDPNPIKFTYNSNYMYYDSDTHYHLGEYLRYLRATEGIDLLPYYNCFNYLMVENLTLTSNEIIDPINETNRIHYSLTENTGFKLVAVPVKYGKSYTIAIDSDTPVTFKTMIYNKDSGLVKNKFFTSNIDATNYNYYTDLLKDDYVEYSITNFSKPFLYTVPTLQTLNANLRKKLPKGEMEKIRQLLHNQESNLYLMIQLAKTNNSSITVLEGDYRGSWIGRTDIKINYEDLGDRYIDATKNLSLLCLNTNQSYAFNSRLIEYLLLNTIDPKDDLPGNIKYLRKYLNTYNNKSTEKLSGIGDQDLRNDLIKYIQTMQYKHLLMDQNGLLNSDIERLMVRTIQITERNI